jgi:parvulin-like peptidyl-prolyl isomerase
MLDSRFVGLDGPGIARFFGERFGAALARLPVGEWAGPVMSGFGVHLVRIESRTEGRTPSLDEVRASVRRDWDNERRTQARDAFVERLLEGYEVVVEKPADTGLETLGDADGNAR